MSTYTVRPSNSEKEAFRVKLTAASLLSLKLRPGDLCTLHLATDDSDTVIRTAVAWENSGNGMKDTIVQTSKTLQELYGLKLGDKVTLNRSIEKLQDAVTVSLRPLNAVLSDEDQTKWSLFASATVPSKHDLVAPRQKLVIEVGNHVEEFEVVDAGGPLARVTNHTNFTFGKSAVSSSLNNSFELELSFEGIGGLQHQKSEIRQMIKQVLNSDAKKAWSRYQVRQGLLVYGNKGTGKSMLLEAVAKSPWSKVIWWMPGTNISNNKDPQVIIFDFDQLPDKTIYVTAMITMFQTIRGTPTVVLGSVRHPNEIPERLRSKNTFSVEIELPIPDAGQRLEILRTLRDDCKYPTDSDLENLASRTHGFVGADLDLLLHEAWDTAFKRHRSTQTAISGLIPGDEKTGSATIDIPELLSSDVDSALSHIRPSALQEIFLEKPNIRWSDIGGQHKIKQQLQNAVEWPLKYPERMKSLGLAPKKGILLYGPPGCSKTLTVKALATEAGLNFLAVKGAELISMYVGESEKATREVFRKARQASPSIIFFDEIDAIASRSGRSGGGGSSDLNVLTTLLNEMDGFEELKNVLVVAATNKPQSIDAALMRPGRFDNVLYIGPPDVETRKEIFDKRFTGVSVEDEVRTRTEEYARVTDGFSGAEIVAICQAAGESAFELGRDVITAGDVFAAISRTPKSITREMLDDYERWNAERMR